MYPSRRLIFRPWLSLRYHWGIVRPSSPAIQVAFKSWLPERSMSAALPGGVGSMRGRIRVGSLFNQPFQGLAGGSQIVAAVD